MTDQQTDLQERELDYWQARAYEAEGKLWKADARIRHLEDTARVLVGEVLKAEAERDSARGYISELETAVKSRNDVVKHRDARIKAVRELHWADKALAGHTCAEDGHDWPCPTVRALESVPPPRPE